MGIIDVERLDYMVKNKYFKIETNATVINATQQTIWT